MGTVASLGRLTDGEEQYIVVTDPLSPDWLDPYVGPNTRVVVAPAVAPLPELRLREQVRRLLGPLRPAARLARRAARYAARRAQGSTWAVAPLDPFIESLRGDVIHFPYQWLHLTGAPSVFNPQDVQYVHWPEFSDASTNTYRQHMYPLWCQASAAIEVPSYATKRDLVTYLRVPHDKILVVPKAPPTEVAAPLQTSTLAEVRQQYRLPDSFALFPGQTWPHKNHRRLLEALALLRDQYGVRLSLVCIGRQNEHWPALELQIGRLGLTEQVHFLGFIPTDHVPALYHLAEFTVFPTLFEGGGFPLLEAFRAGSPLVCSNIPVLTEQAGDAALYFDPLSSADIARALLEAHTDESVRARLRHQGAAQVTRYSWDRTARTYRALYRNLARRPLSEEDDYLLQQAARQPAHGSMDTGAPL